MGLRWTSEEDEILIASYNDGHCDRSIAAILTERGFARTSSGVERRRLYDLNLAHRTADFSKVEMHVDVVPSYRELDDAFCAALRKHHPEKETGPSVTMATKSVPSRALPSPLFSSTGFMTF